MADQKISDLSAAGALTGTELVEVVQSGGNVQTTTQSIANLSSGAGHVIEDEGTPLTQRTKLNFVGAGVTVTDDSGDDASVVTIPGGGAISDTAFGGGWNADTTNGASKNALYDEFILKQYLVNAATAITDASTMDITAIKHTLTTSSATRTFTISYTGDDITLEVTLNAVDSIFTFPAAALCVSEGIASGDNTLEISGVSGDKYLIQIKKIGSNYYVVSKRFGQ